MHNGGKIFCLDYYTIFCLSSQIFHDGFCDFAFAVLKKAEKFTKKFKIFPCFLFLFLERYVIIYLYYNVVLPKTVECT